MHERCHPCVTRLETAGVRAPGGRVAAGEARAHIARTLNLQVSLIPLLQAGLGQALQDQPLAALAVLFGAGLVTSLTPCIYPMIPITVGVIGGSAGTLPSRGRLVGLTLTYVAGLSLLYASLGLLAGLSGTLFGTVSSNPWARFAIANLLLLFGLAMLDVLPVAAPQRLVRWAAGLGGGSYPAVFLLGATSGLVAAPCGAPAFAAVLTWVSTTGSAVLGFSYLFVFSLGMSALLVAVGIFSGLAARLPRAGRWTGIIKKLAGILMIGMAEYYLVLMGTVL
ncbi:MAG: cytochrome C biogenesis protein [Gemmatimonadetes bacterium]|nr:cytochrome C biogenesis protein [Gemmatimonadota bacterium]